jgi:hypothetical protein
VGQSARDGTQDVRVPAQIQRPAQRNGTDDGDQRPGYLLRDLLRADDDHQHRDRNRQGVEVDLLELLQVGPDLAQGAVSTPLEAKHARELPERDLHANPGQETDQYRAREKVRQEPKADGTRQYEEARGHDGKHRGQRHVLV